MNLDACAFLSGCPLYSRACSVFDGARLQARWTTSTGLLNSSPAWLPTCGNEAYPCTMVSALTSRQAGRQESSALAAAATAAKAGSGAPAYEGSKPDEIVSDFCPALNERRSALLPLTGSFLSTFCRPIPRTTRTTSSGSVANRVMLCASIDRSQQQHTTQIGAVMACSVCKARLSLCGKGLLGA